MALPTLTDFTANTVARSSDVDTNFQNLRDRDTISSANTVTIESTGNHVVINAGTSKLVKIQVLRQDDTSDAYNANTVVLTGWGYIQGDSTAHLTEAVTFGITFSSAPVVIIGRLGNKTGAPANITELTSAPNSATGPIVSAAGAYSITTSGLTVSLGRSTGTFNNTAYHGYSWIALGQLS